MNDVDKNIGTMEVEELYKKGKEFLGALHENELTPFEYKEMTEQERERADEQIAKTLGISSEEMRGEYANQIGWAKTGLYNQHIEKLEALKEEDFEKVKEIDKEMESLRNAGNFYELTKETVLHLDRLKDDFLERNRELIESYDRKN